jgi:hypothetical protein
MTPAINNKIKELKNLTENYGLDKDITVFRGTTTDYFNSDKWDVGKTEQLNMFVSTSANIWEARRFANIKAGQGHPPLLIEMRVAKDTKGFYIGDNTFYGVSAGEKKNEHEFLLGSNLRQTVISKETKGQWQYWVVEVRNE